MQLVESTREDGEGEALTFEVGAGDVFANEMIKARPPVLRPASACVDDPTQLSVVTQYMVCRQWTLRYGAWQLVTKPGWKCVRWCILCSLHDCAARVSFGCHQGCKPADQLQW